MKRSLLESFTKDRGKRDDILVSTGMPIQPGQEQGFWVGRERLEPGHPTSRGCWKPWGSCKDLRAVTYSANRMQLAGQDSGASELTFRVPFPQPQPLPTFKHFLPGPVSIAISQEPSGSYVLRVWLKPFMSDAQMEIELAVTGPTAAGGRSPGVSPVKKHPEYPGLSDACNRQVHPEWAQKSKEDFKLFKLSLATRARI